MRRVFSCAGFIFVFATSLIADSNLRIAEVGLHGYGSPTLAVRVILRNPSSQAQAIHLQISASSEREVANTVTTDVTLNGGERRELELPVLMQAGKMAVTVDATSA